VTKQVVVIGAGIVGLCAALCCVDRGWRVLVVERNGEQRDGCSFGNAGMIVPSHFVPLAAPGAVVQGLKWMFDASSPFYVRPRASWELIAWAFRFWRASNAEHVRRAAPLLRDLNLASRAWYEAFAATDDTIGLNQGGTLMLCKTQHALDEEAGTAEHARTLGITAEVLDAKQTAAIDPGVRMDVIGCVHFPADCNLIPDRLMAIVQRRLSERGARFAWNTEISDFRVENDTIRAASSRERVEYEADEFVLAAGSWSSPLGRRLGIRIPMQAGKGYSLTLPRPRQMPKAAAILTEARVAVSPMGSALRFGGTMELAGLDEGANRIRVRSIMQAIPRYYPDFAAGDFAGVEPWRGLRPCSPDGLPYIGRTARLSNLVIATGHAMMGVSLAPITGKLAAQVIAGERPGIDMSLLSPDRFQ
jgi:D-amino-acid dehydrogenase